MQGKSDDKLSLEYLGLENVGKIHRNLTTPFLYEEALRRHEGVLAHAGPLVVNTSPYTGRLPKDKFIVHEPVSARKIGWGKVNRPFEASRFEEIKNRVFAYLQCKDLFVQDCFAGADPQYRLSVRVVTERASHSLFARNMFIRAKNDKELEGYEPEFTILQAPGFHADPKIDGTHSDAFILLNFAEKLVLIGGTSYGGEIKKSVFTIMNYLLPQKGIMTMHASANYGKNKDDVAIFFGLSGTGKTTLSATADRTLIGDDEHGWSDKGVFNFEGGCYAKVINLSPKGEPEIYATTKRFGTLLENVGIDAVHRTLDLDDNTITENTRASYPIDFIPNMTPDGYGGHPKNVIMLTCDAFGVLPPVAKLTPEQAMYHFVLGYTAKVAGTETGIKEPQATYSSCFGEPFMALQPATYAKLLGEKVKKYKVDTWLVNTGWNGGPFGEGKRMDLGVTRAIVKAILSGKLKSEVMHQEPFFGLSIPSKCPGVPAKMLDPKATWKDPSRYDEKARELARQFDEHYREAHQQPVTK